MEQTAKQPHARAVGLPASTLPNYVLYSGYHPKTRNLVLVEEISLNFWTSLGREADLVVNGLGFQFLLAGSVAMLLHGKRCDAPASLLPFGSNPRFVRYDLAPSPPWSY